MPVVCALLVASCGGAAPSGPDVATRSSGGEAGVISDDGGAGEDGALPADGPAIAIDTAPASYAGGCPSVLPAPGPCAPEGRACTYGQAVHLDCRDRATCKSGRWAIVRGTCPALSPPAQCPASPVPGGACSGSLLCSYPSGTECACSAGKPLPAQWLCDLPRMEPGCPPTPPNAGTACTGIPHNCNYTCGSLGATNVSTYCEGDGVWTVAESPCGAPGG
jgi:hypothetical protein